MDGNGAKFIYYQKIGGYFLIVEKNIDGIEVLDTIREMNDEIYFRQNNEKKCLTETVEYINLKNS
tara:strand:- start:726 stop:920 length:195 start_codon:yes stop_codon:yes gene_type:complete